MGIYTKLYFPLRVSPLDKALARLYYGTEAVGYFQRDKMFIPKKVSIWLYAPSKSLDGKLIYETEIVDFYEISQTLKTRFTSSFNREELFSSIVMFEGEWNINGLETNGFFSCNNYYSWNRAYMDIEIDAYSRGEYGDLLDVFLKNNEVPELTKSFITNIKLSSQRQNAIPRYIYFSRGAPEYGEVEDLVALHLKDRHDMTGFLYAKLRKTEEAWIKEKVEPIDKTFYLNSLVSIEVVESLFTEVVKEIELVERLGNSVTYIAKDTQAFSKFFERFKETIFKPASNELPDAKKLKADMQRGLEKTRTRTF